MERIKPVTKMLLNICKLNNLTQHKPNYCKMYGMLVIRCIYNDKRERFDCSSFRNTMNVHKLKLI